MAEISTPAPAAGGGMSTKTAFLIIGGVAVTGILAYFIFRKPAAPAPVIYAGGVVPPQSSTLSTGLAALGGIAGSLFSKKATTVPPLVVTGWSAGNATFTLGSQTGTLNPLANNSAGGATITAGTYTLNVDWDGTGYNILIMQGSTIANSIYVTGTGSFSFIDDKK